MRDLRTFFMFLLGLVVFPAMVTGQTMVLRVTDFGINARVVSSASFTSSGLPTTPAVPVGTVIGTVEVGDDMVAANDYIRVNNGPVATNSSTTSVVASTGTDQVTVAWQANGCINFIVIAYTQVSSNIAYL